MKKSIKKRNDVRVNDIPDNLYKIIKEKSKKNVRKYGQEIIAQLKEHNNLP